MITFARSAFVLIALMPAYAQAQTAFSLSPAERRAIAKNMDATVQDVMGFESQCAKGFTHSCDVLREYKTKTASQVRAEALDKVRKACAAGDLASCEVLNLGADQERREREGAAQLKQDLIKRYSAKCAAGDQRACKNLSSLK